MTVYMCACVFVCADTLSTAALVVWVQVPGFSLHIWANSAQTKIKIGKKLELCHIEKLHDRHFPNPFHFIITSAQNLLALTHRYALADETVSTETQNSVLLLGLLCYSDSLSGLASHR